MTHHYTDLGSDFDWLKQISLAAQPIRSTTRTWVVPCHQYRISAVVSQTLFNRETSGGIAKCRLFSQATNPTARQSRGGEVLPYMGYIGMYMTHPGSTNDLSEVDVHPVVTAYKMSIVRLTIFQFHQLGKKRKHL